MIRRAVLAVALGLLAGCREDMHDTPRYEAYEASDFFPDGKSARHPPEGTVPRGGLGADLHLARGLVDGEPAPTFPFRIERADLERGRDRFAIFCRDCHDPAGTGRGMIVRRGYVRPPSFHEERLRQAPPGHFFVVMTHGFGDMPSFASRIPVEDRWRIVAWIRVLQRSRHASVEDLAATERARLESGR